MLIICNSSRSNIYNLLFKLIFVVPFFSMRDTFSKGSLEDIRRVIEKTKDHDTLVTCISVMRKYVFCLYS